ncbi:MAG: LysM peptidoglycan-binding domain-containing protein [Gammaproteobacteria bacterium]
MGMFDFIADVGENIFSGDDDAADSIYKQINQGLPGAISNLKVEFKDGFVTLGGECDTARTKRIATLTAGNNKGVQSVGADGLVVKAVPVAEPATTPIEPAVEVVDEEPGEYYTIQSGDTLSGIAKTHYGNAMDYTKIFEANREVIKDPDKIYPGQKIFLPNI